MEPKQRLVLLTLHPFAGPEAQALGLACLAAAVRADPFLAERLELSVLEPDPAELAAMGGVEGLAGRILAAGADLVGMSLYVWNRRELCGLARALKLTRPELWLAAGGPEAGGAAEAVRADGGFDLVVAGEGEVPFLAALRARFGAAAPSQAAVWPHLPSPWLDGSLRPSPGGGALWELARGCPYHCSFCYESRGERGVRFIPTERLKAELALFERAGVRELFVLDPTFNTKRSRSLEILGLLGERQSQGWDCHFRFEVRAELLDAAQAAGFAALQCSLQIGLQSAHPAVLEKIGRSLDRSAFAQKIGLLNQAGVVFGFDLIRGLPGDSYEGFLASLDWALGLEPNHLDLFTLAVLPGTRLAEAAPGFGLTWQPQPPYQVLETPQFGAAELKQAECLSRAVELFYNRGRAVPWFAAVARALGRKPSGLLAAYADWIEAHPVPEQAGHAEIESSQLACLDKLGQPLPEPLPALLRQVIQVQGAWSRAWADQEESRIALNWPLELLEGPEVRDLRRLARRAPGPLRQYRVYPRAGRVMIETIKPQGRRR